MRGLKGVQSGEGRTEKAEGGGGVPAGPRAGLEHDIAAGSAVNIRIHITSAAEPSLLAAV